jgi:hypothetical protein
MHAGPSALRLLQEHAAELQGVAAHADKWKGTVGEMRQQSCYCAAERPLSICTDDPELEALAASLVVVESYPETDGSFKIKVRRREARR